MGSPARPFRRTAAVPGGGIRRAQPVAGERISPARRSRRARVSKIQPWLCVELPSEALTRARPAEAWFPSAPFASVLSSPGKTQRSVQSPSEERYPHPSLILTDGKNDSIGQNWLPRSINVAASVPGARGGWAPRQETAEGGAIRAACPSRGQKTWILKGTKQMWSDSHGNVSQLNSDSPCIFQAPPPPPQSNTLSRLKIG